MSDDCKMKKEYVAFLKALIEIPSLSGEEGEAAVFIQNALDRSICWRPRRMKTATQWMGLPKASRAGSTALNAQSWPVCSGALGWTLWAQPKMPRLF